MYTNGNLEAHMAAMCFLGTVGLSIALAVATIVLLFVRRKWAAYPLLAIALLLAGYAVVLGAFSWASFDRIVARGDEKFSCALDCHIAYSVQNVERMKSIGDATAQGEFVVVTLRSHFDERTIAPWRGNAPLTPAPPELALIDHGGHSYPVSPVGQKAWEVGYPQPQPPNTPLRPGESYQNTWVFEVPADAQTVRLFAGWNGFPAYVLIGDEATPRHGRTYFAL